MNERCVLVIAVMLVASLAMNYLPAYAANAGMNATVLNTAPTVHLSLIHI